MKYGSVRFTHGARNEEGTFGNGSYNLGCLLYSAQGSSSASSQNSGGDSQGGTGYSATDSYGGGQTSSASGSLTAAGICLPQRSIWTRE